MEQKLGKLDKAVLSVVETANALRQAELRADAIGIAKCAREIHSALTSVYTSWRKLLGIQSHLLSDLIGSGGQLQQVLRRQDTDALAAVTKEIDKAGHRSVDASQRFRDGFAAFKGKAGIKAYAQYQFLSNAYTGAAPLGGNPATGRRNDEALKDLDPLAACQVRGVGEYRLPPIGMKPSDLNDGRWYRSLSETHLREKYQGEKCGTLYGPLNCTALRQGLDRFYSDARNLRIPDLEAEYIVAQETKGISDAEVELETNAARIWMGQYYKALKGAGSK